MQLKFVTDPQEISTQKWQQFVDGHAAGNIFQTPYMYRVYQKADSCQPLTCFFVDEAAEVKGVLVGMVQEFANGLANRVVVSGGPLIEKDDESILADFLSRYNSFVQNRGIYTEIRNLADTDHLKAGFTKNEYTYEEHLNILVDLRKDEETLWGEVQSNGRNKIRRAGKRGPLSNMSRI